MLPNLAAFSRCYYIIAGDNFAKYPPNGNLLMSLLLVDVILPREAI